MQVTCAPIAWHPKALPQTLVHVQNCKFLLGEFLKSSSTVAVINALLKEYAAEIDLLSLVNGTVVDQCVDIVAMISIDADGCVDIKRKFEVKKGQIDKQPGGPKLYLFIKVPNKPRRNFIVDLFPLFFNAGSVSGLYAIYAHTFSLIDRDTATLGSEDSASYIGVTKRGWATRFGEHVRSAKNGSDYHFHHAIREWSAKASITHFLLGCGRSFEEVMNLEEFSVENYSLRALHPTGLNMIPGGFAGLRWLAKYGVKPGASEYENRHVLLRRLDENCRASGIANPALSLRWLDNEFAAKMIFANPRNLRPDQVREIRLLNEFGFSPKDIGFKLGCDENRVRRLLDGVTYARVA